MTPDYDLAHVLPHRPPLLLVDRLRAVDLPAGRLVAERRLSADDPWLAAQGELSPLLVVEALCQAAACLNGIEARAAQRGGPKVAGPQRHRGYLVSAAGFEFPDRARVGERLSLQVAREGRMGAMVSFQARAEAHAPDGGDGAPGGPAAGSDSATGRLVAAGRLLFAVTIA